MFVTVKYGDEQEQIVNINCRNAILLQFIKTKSGCNAEDLVELSDERGKVKNLRGYPRNYARQHLKEREVLILLKVHNDMPSKSCGKNTRETIVYTPLLTSLLSNSEFNAMLNPPKNDEEVCDIISAKSSRTRSFISDSDEYKKTKSKYKRKSSRKIISRKGSKSSNNL